MAPTCFRIRYCAKYNIFFFFFLRVLLLTQIVISTKIYTYIKNKRKKDNGENPFPKTKDNTENISRKKLYRWEYFFFFKFWIIMMNNRIVKIIYCKQYEACGSGFIKFAIIANNIFFFCVIFSEKLVLHCYNRLTQRK